MSEMHDEQAPEEQVNITFEDEEVDQEAEAPEETAEVAEPGATPAPPEEPEKVEFTPEQQEKFNTEIGKKTAKIYEERQRAEAAEARLKELEEQQGKQERPTVPPPVDPYDPQYAEKVAARDKAIGEQAAYDAQQQTLMEQQQRQEMEAAQARQAEMVATINTYSERAQTLGITPQDLQQAGSVVNAVGVNDEVALHILNDPLGPQITVHLAKNLGEMEKIQSMTPTQAAVYIENTVKPAAQGSQKKVNPPPEPVDHLSGRGEPERQRGPKGATFE